VIRQWTTGQWALRVTMVAGTLLGLSSTALVGPGPSVLLSLVVGVLALTWARLPQSPVGTAALGLVLVWWGVALRDGLHPQALIAAGGLLAAHLAGLLASYGPDELPVDPATVRLWLRRGAAVFALAPATWLVAALLDGTAEPPGIWLAGLAAALAATLVATVAYSAER
jgi:hypothetical protein